MQGLHLTADLRGCRCPTRRLTDAAELLVFCVQSVNASGLQAVAQLSHRFPDTDQGPGGVTITVLLAESHLCVHTWPEQAAVTLDVYVCNMGGNHSRQAHHLLDTLLLHFDPSSSAQHAIHRGGDTAGTA
nr:S-adenosylmethionine decarboxylase [uncultured Rhodoferax sp.]